LLGTGFLNAEIEWARAASRRAVEKAKERTVPAIVENTEEDELRRILAYVRTRTGHDFTQYQRATVVRRIARRVKVTRNETLSQYYN